MPIPGLSGIAVKFALALSAGALFAFGLGYFTSQLRSTVSEIDQKGYERGAAETALAQRVEIGRLQAAAKKAADDARRAASERIAQSEAEQSEQLARLRAALEREYRNDPVNLSCDGRPYPDGLRINTPGA